MTDAIASTDALETRACSRCGGSGRHSYNQISGSRCFDCAGKGRELTPRGKAAAAFLADLRSQPASAFVPGDLVRTEMVGGGSIAACFATVVEVREIVMRTTICGEDCDIPMISIDCTGRFGRTGMTVAPDKILRRGFDAAAKADQLARAIAFQDTLDARGRPVARPVARAA